MPYKDPYYKSKKISQWRRVNGLKLKENQTYDEIYETVMNTKNCELCKTELCEGRKTNGRTMDHDHITGFFRMVLCRKCNSGYKRELQKNNTTGIRNIIRFENGWRYQAKDKSFTKYSKNKELVMWAKFIHELLQR